MTASFIRVALKGPFRQGLDYLVPPELTAVTEADLGKRVWVPLGTRKEVGVIVAQSDRSDLNSEKLKALIEIIDAAPVLSKVELELLEFMSAYYHCSMGDACMTMLPSLLAAGKKLRGRTQAQVLPKPEVGQLLKNTELQLNSAQSHAFTAMAAALNQFQVFLLEGVTGSGKTEVYLQLAHKVLQRGGQVLLLVPEIGLAPQTLARFQTRFNARVAEYHSGMTDAKRREVWRQGLDDEIDLVIGTRSSVFLPLTRLQLIIIDEEHDLSFKQQTGVYYSAKSLAIKRAQLLNIPIVLGSATPALESLQHAYQGQYQHFQLKERPGAALLPKFYRIDMRRQPSKKPLSQLLLDAMRRHLEAGQQVLIFLNRRGFAPILMCHHCAYRAECPHCDITLSLHQQPRLLMCHHCGLAKRVPDVCPECKTAANLITVGLGTEQIEAELQQVFPDYPLLRIDQDATREKGSLQQMLQQIEKQEAKIIVGTQMLAKGHHFDGITMVGIVDLDYGLFAPDFRALERMGQLLVQVSGRAGRADKPGEVYLQTHVPDHPLLTLLLQEGYANFAQALVAERKQAFWPPFSYLALIRAEAKNESELREFLQGQKNQLLQMDAEVQIFGPVAAFLGRRAGKYRAQLLLQAKARKSLHRVLAQLEFNLMQAPNRRVRWMIDVDPLELG